MALPILYNQADRTIRVSIVDGSTRVGLRAVDGSINVVVSPNDGVKRGSTHSASGARYGLRAPASNISFFAPDGSHYLSTTPFTTRGTPVTVVSGVLP
jgi:hypothetical protein